MDSPLRIGIYSPFFGSTVGGGEKYLAVTAEAVRDGFPGSRVEIISPVPADRERYERMLQVDLHDIELVSTRARVTRLHRLLGGIRALRLYRDLFVSAQAARSTRRYDLFLSMVYVLPAFTKARRSVILCQFPYSIGPISWKRWGALTPLYLLYQLPYRLLRPPLLGAGPADFDKVVCQSEYVRHWVRTYWYRDADVVNPPIDIPAAEPDLEAKRNLILSVGRYFAGGHNKKHDVMVRAFREMVDAGLTGWELHLAGSVHHDAASTEYLQRVRELAAGYPVHIHEDVPYDDLQALYARAAVYWHAAGYGVDVEESPIEIEHFGMTTAEAMAHGAVPVVIAAGGQLEVLEDGVSGFHWKDPSGLREQTLRLVRDPALRRRMAVAARARARRYSRSEFKRRMRESLAPLVADLESARASRDGAGAAAP